MKRILTPLLFIVFVMACKKVPITDRNQFNIIPNSELNSSSFTSYNKVLKESELSDNTAQTQMVRKVGNRIKGAVEKYLRKNNFENATEGFKWEFNLIAENVVNAWCMPGGKVAFYEGILPVCQNEAGIAVVMGHEVAHAIAKHGGERMTQSLVQQGVGIGLSVALQQQPQQTQNLVMAAYTGGSTVLGILPFSRLQESEADEMGIQFMALAGYNPSEAPKFWKRMRAASGGSSTPVFLSTHPSNDKRIDDLSELLPEAKKYYAKSKKANNQPIPGVASVSTKADKSKSKTKIKMTIDN